MHKLSSLIFILILQLNYSNAQQMDTTFLKKLLESKSNLFSGILNHSTKNEVQVMYTQINRDKFNHPQFKHFGYRIDDQHYFYPASTVKLAAVVFALEKINELKIKNLSVNSEMITDSTYNGQTKVVTDYSAENSKPSIAHYVKKILLTSDNDAFNRLYEFIGRAEINKKLQKHGMYESRILNRLAIGDGGESARHTNQIRFYTEGKLIYTKPAEYDNKNYPLALKRLIVGKAYMDSNDQLVNKPYSFEDKNVFTIKDQQHLMMKLMMPDNYPKNEQFNLTKSNYQLIYTYMSMYPSESKFPKYNKTEFWDTYAKMLYYGRQKNIVPSTDIRIFNKYGDSYGFIIDNAYFIDFKNRVEFFLTAVVQSNEDEIYNDNKYEYETVCYPFMKNLGQTIYEYELNRKKEFIPDLSKYKMNYK